MRAERIATWLIAGLSVLVLALLLADWFVRPAYFILGMP